MAQVTHQPLEEVAFQAIQGNLPPLVEDLPDEWRQDLAELQNLDDEAVWTITKEPLSTRAVQFYGYVIASRPGRQSNPHVAGGRLLRPLHFLAMTRPESLELNSPGVTPAIGVNDAV